MILPLLRDMHMLWIWLVKATMASTNKNLGTGVNFAFSFKVCARRETR